MSNKPNSNLENVEVLYAVSVSEVSHLEGMMLTLVDAAISDPEQRKALKDLVRQNVWQWAEAVARRVEASKASFTFTPTDAFPVGQ